MITMVPEKMNNELWYAVDSATKKIFKDMNNKNLPFLSEESCIDWCHSRNEIENICFITGKRRY